MCNSKKQKGAVDKDGDTDEGDNDSDCESGE